MTQLQERTDGAHGSHNRRLAQTRDRRPGDVVDGETQELRDIGRGIRRLWWLPALLAVVGIGAGVVAATQVPRVYRSAATVLVGPTDGSVTHSSTVRTSEDLASFYADMARRQIILGPVAERLGFHQWYNLRSQVSAVVPPQNPRLVTVTVMGASQATATRAADGIVDRLTRLSPGHPGGDEQQFVNEQASNLQTTINDAQQRINDLKNKLARAVDPAQRGQLQGEISQREALVVEWQKNYVDLITAEPTSDAGGLQVIDQAAPVSGMGRSGITKQAVLGGGVGLVLGLVLAWLAAGRPSRPEPEIPDRRFSPDDLPGALPSPHPGPANGTSVKREPGESPKSPAPDGRRTNNKRRGGSPGRAAARKTAGGNRDEQRGRRPTGGDSTEGSTG